MKCQIWTAFEHSGGCRTGILVSEYGDLDRLIAYVATNGEWGARTVGRELAQRIARNPRCLDWIRHPEVFDLRNCGRVGIEMGNGLPDPMPGIVYTILVSPAGKSAEHSRPVQPYCPWLERAMNASKGRLGLTTEGRSESADAPASRVSGRGFCRKEKSGRSEPLSIPALASSRAPTAA